MTSFRVWDLAHVGLVLVMLAGSEASADDRAARDREAEAALALAATARPVVAMIATAPAPREKVSAKPGCVCGAGCTCKSGDCPQRCPTATSVPTPMPKPVQRQPELVGYYLERQCVNGTCYIVQVPVYR